MTLNLRFTWTADADQTLPPPEYASAGAAGVDLRLNLSAPERVNGFTLASGERAFLPTGLILEIPQGFEAQIRPRSGLALKHGVSVLNSPGTIDSDYRGEIRVLIINYGQEVVTLSHRARIAQLVIAPIMRVVFCASQELSETKRGTGGFGSTGAQ